MSALVPLSPRACAGTLVLSLLLTACHSTALPSYQTSKSYYYRLKLLTPGVEYQLRAKQWRFSQFQQPAPANAVMFAYFIEYHGGGGYSIFSPPKSTRLDTVELAVPAAGADSLFLLAQRFFHTLQPSNVDTTWQGRREYVQTDDAGGSIQLTWQGQRLLGEVDALHASSRARQSHAFWQVHRCFSQLFQHPATQKGNGVSIAREPR